MLRNLGFCLCDHIQLASRWVSILFSIQDLHDLHKLLQIPYSADLGSVSAQRWTMKGQSA